MIPSIVGGLGPSSVFNVTSGMVTQGLGMKYTSIDYPGPAQLTLGLLRNDVQFMLTTPSLVKQQLDAGTLTMIGVLAEERYSDMPDVPSVREAGYKGYVPQVWNGFFTARGTPMAVRERIARDILAIVDSPEGKARFASFTGVLQRSSPQQFAKELEEETRQWREFFVRTGFKPE